jgi:hypothetical protein
MVQRYSDLKKRRGTLTAKVTGFAATFQQAHVELTQPSRRNMFDFNNLPDKQDVINAVSEVKTNKQEIEQLLNAFRDLGLDIQ